jgi:hypothetical protein
LPTWGDSAVKWKLWTRNDIIGKGFDEYVSKDAALERARDIIRQPHVKVLYIEEPDGSHIEFEDIEAWCKG